MSCNRVLAVALGGCLLLGSVAPSQARDRDDRCGQRVRKAEQNYDKAVRKHGEHSRQAEQRRRQVEQARANCNEHRDHDRDHDHDQDRDRR